MPTYTYKARDVMGKPIKGAMDATTREELIDKLHKMGYMTTHVKETPRISINIESIFEKLKTISTESMIMFNVQLSNMINAGISILASLDMLYKQTANKRLRDIVKNVKVGIEAGNSFSQALSCYPSVFSDLFVSIIRVGETSGKLDTVLARFAEYSEHQADLKQKITGAIFYPTILLFAGICVISFIVTFIIPQFAEIFMKTGIKLPFVTLILYNIGIGIKYFWHTILLFIVITILAVTCYANTKTGRWKIDMLKLRLPLIGPLYRKTAISRFARTLGTMVASGIPILEALDITKGVMGNEVLARVIDDTRSSVEKGQMIGESLKGSGEFPPDTAHMISVGEETGNLDMMLNKISDFYDMSVGYMIKKLTVMIEPVFLVIMGSLVGLIMASMLLPMFDMIKILKH